jgi:hypothetical protein
MIGVVSLTSELKDAQSPLSVFTAASFPGTKELAAAFRAVRPADGEGLQPTVPAGTRVPWGTLNAAVDHRLRYAFTGTSELPEGMSIVLTKVGRLVAPAVAAAIRKTGMDLWNMLDELVAMHQPGDRSRPLSLPASAEGRLSRLCYAMVWFEEVYRTGRLWPGTPLADAGPALTASGLLEAVPDFAVDDLIAQARFAADALGDLRASYPPSAVYAGPTFAGSTDVDGADADLIIGDLLIDVKGTVTPSRLRKPEFYQLLGYALLDFDDEYGIRRLGFYLSRFGRLITWTVEEYLALLGSTRSVAELRRDCAEMLWVDLCPAKSIGSPASTDTGAGVVTGCGSRPGRRRRLCRRSRSPGCGPRASPRPGRPGPRRLPVRSARR